MGRSGGVMWRDLRTYIYIELGVVNELVREGGLWGEEGVWGASE